MTALDDSTLNALRAFPDLLEAHFGLIPPCIGTGNLNRGKACRAKR